MALTWFHNHGTMNQLKQNILLTEALSALPESAMAVR
ncbi:hypothetical protein L1278_002264 [Pontibacter sp. HSC-36F09]|nr:hypothetical protein [Pontibacter sp. HSC-36F09]